MWEGFEPMLQQKAATAHTHDYGASKKRRFIRRIWAECLFDYHRSTRIRVDASAWTHFLPIFYQIPTFLFKVLQYVVYILNVAKEVLHEERPGTYLIHINLNLPSVLLAIQPPSNSAQSFMPLKLPQTHYTLTVMDAYSRVAINTYHGLFAFNLHGCPREKRSHGLNFVFV